MFWFSYTAEVEAGSDPFPKGHLNLYGTKSFATEASVFIKKLTLQAMKLKLLQGAKAIIITDPCIMDQLLVSHSILLSIESILNKASGAHKKQRNSSH